MITDRPPLVPAAARWDDKIFFKEHSDRKFRIRKPFLDEFTTEFRGFGMHAEERRRVIVWRLPAGMAKRHMVDFGRVAFLLFSDETVEDNDYVLKPILDGIMKAEVSR